MGDVNKRWHPGSPLTGWLLAPVILFTDHMVEATATTDLWPAFSHAKKEGSHLPSRLWQSLEACRAVTKYRSLIPSLVCHPVFVPTVHQSIHPSIHPSVLLRFLNAPGITRWSKLKCIPPYLCVLVFLCVRKHWDCHKCQVGIYW